MRRILLLVLIASGLQGCVYVQTAQPASTLSVELRPFPPEDYTVHYVTSFAEKEMERKNGLYVIEIPAHRSGEGRLFGLVTVDRGIPDYVSVRRAGEEVRRVRADALRRMAVGPHGGHLLPLDTDGRTNRESQ